MIPMLAFLASITIIVYASLDSFALTAKTQRDAETNAEINLAVARVQKIVETQWSCTASLSGAVYLEQNAMIIKDPIDQTHVLATEQMGSGNFWKISKLRMSDVHEEPGRPGVLNGTLDFEFTKTMTVQVGTPKIHRTIKNILFSATPDGTISQCYPGTASVTLANAACQAVGGVWNASQSFGSQCELPKKMPTPIQTVTNDTSVSTDVLTQPAAASSPAPIGSTSSGGGSTPSPTPTVTTQVVAEVSPTPTPTAQPSALPSTQPSPTPSPSASPSPLATASPKPQAAPKGVCMSGKAAFIALPNSKISMTGNGTSASEVYLLEQAKLSLTGNASIQGDLHLGSGCGYTQSGNATVSSVKEEDLGSIYSDLTKFVAEQTALKPTQQYTAISGNTQITGKGKHNVVQINGDLILSGNNTLTLSGNSSDTFTVNVLGKITVSGNAAIKLAGGVTANNVLFNNLGQGNEIVLSGNGNVAGTFIALKRGAQISGNGVLEGAVVAGGGTNTRVSISGNGLATVPNPYCHIDNDENEGE